VRGPTDTGWSDDARRDGGTSEEERPQPTTAVTTDGAGLGQLDGQTQGMGLRQGVLSGSGGSDAVRQAAAEAAFAAVRATCVTRQSAADGDRLGPQTASRRADAGRLGQHEGRRVGSQCDAETRFRPQVLLRQEV